MRKIGGSGTREGSRAVFFKKIDTSYHSSSSCVFWNPCSFTFDAQRTFVALLFAHPMTQKSLNLANESGKFWKVFNDEFMFSDVQFYPNTKEI
jgi:hypothetical protein